MAVMPVMTPASHQVAQTPGPLTSYLRDHCHASPSEPPQKRAGAKRRTRQSRRRQTSRPNPAQKRREPQRRIRDRSSNISSHVTTTTEDDLGLKCNRCGAVIRYPNEHRCEDCFADDVDRWPGNDQSATLHM